MSVRNNRVCVVFGLSLGMSDGQFIVLSNRLLRKGIAKSRFCPIFSFVYRIIFVNFLKLLLVYKLFSYLCRIQLRSYSVLANKKIEFFCYVPDFS